jgi:hypothetical protein
MKASSFRLLYWSPRIVGLLFAGLTSIFALDVFDGQHAFWQTVLALLMHLIPTLLVLALLAVAWRWEWFGALSFAALGLGYVIGFWGRFHWVAYVMIAGPLLLLSGLFLANWLCQRKAQLGCTQ